MQRPLSPECPVPRSILLIRTMMEAYRVLTRFTYSSEITRTTEAHKSVVMMEDFPLTLVA